MSHEGSRIRVLHVDDDGDLCALAARYLERANDDVEVVTETSARDGLERLQADAIDCVVSDHDMPGMDGLEFLHEVREHYPDLPFILFTGKGSEEIASEAISAGVTDYLQKGTTGEQYELLANRIERGVGEVRTQAALEESERTFATLVANLPGMVYRCHNEPGWPMTFVSEGAKKLTGYDAAAIEDGDVDWGEDVIVEADRQEMWESVQLALAADEPFEVSYRIRTADGDVRWVWERGRIVERGDEARGRARDGGDGTSDRQRDGGDETSGEGAESVVIEGFVTDITARRTREQELEAEREFTRSVVDSLEDIFVVVDADGSIVRWNDQVPAVTGYDDGDITEMTLAGFFHPAAADRVETARERARDDGVATVEAALVTADGRGLPYEFRLAPVEYGDDRRLCAIGRNVRNVKQREQELERYETVIQAVGDPMYTLDTEGRFTFVNDALADLTGTSPEDLVGTSIGEFIDAEAFRRGQEEIRTLLTEDERQYAILEMDVLTADGDRIPCEAHIALLPMPDGVFRGTAGVIRDITARKERERRLEEFASVVSHDLRNPLEVLAGRVELARETGDVAHLDAVERPIDRMHTLIEDLLELAQRGEGVDELQRVDLATTAEEAWHSIRTDGAALHVAGSTVLEADAGRLQALFENLFRNALEHACSDGTGGDGRDRDGIGSGERDSDGPRGERRSRETVAVTVGTTAAGFFVADDGVGIPENERGVVFERGYTTRHEGTGYGLAIVADVVEAHGWTIDVTESEEGGARFEVTI